MQRLRIGCIAQELRLVAEEMVAGRLTVDEAATELDRRADAILEKRRWMLDEAADAASLAAAAAAAEATP